MILSPTCFAAISISSSNSYPDAGSFKILRKKARGIARNPVCESESLHPRTVESKLREYTHHADITFTRVAVLEEQIRDLDLPTRPTKVSDSRSAKFKG